MDFKEVTPEEYRFLYELESSLWWFVGMREITAALLGRLPIPKSPRVLDAGCGTGHMLGWLRNYCGASDVVGLDTSPEALRFCWQRKERLLVRGSVEQLPFWDGVFDLVLSLDVLGLFDLERARVGFGELARVLCKGGILFVRVPAFQWLYSYHDRATSNVHRYNARELARCVSDSGLSLVRVTYANTLLFPLAVVRRWSHQPDERQPRSDVRPLPKALRWANPLLARLLALEAAWLRHVRWRLPFGVSVIGVAVKE